jgi:hypothetical protein
MNVELIGNLISIVAEGDSRPIKIFLDELSQIDKENNIELYPELFMIMIHSLFKNQSGLKEETIKFFNKLTKENPPAV